MGSNQTKPIYHGLKDNNFEDNKLIVVENLKDAMSEAYRINTYGKQRVILLENDLPDNY
ncbi:hypothetical protein D3C72_1233050 [compost metagenome]